MNSIEERFANIKTYSEGGQPSLHKPLLLLFALGYCFRGSERMIPFSVIDSALIRLFDEFYPTASERANTHYPFGSLESDGIWELEQSVTLNRTSVGHLFKSELRLRRHFSRNLLGRPWRQKERKIGDELLPSAARARPASATARASAALRTTPWLPH